MLPFVPMQCKCSDALQQKKCVMDGIRYDDGARWAKNNCSVCKCEVSERIIKRISGWVLIDSKQARANFFSFGQDLLAGVFPRLAADACICLEI